MTSKEKAEDLFFKFSDCGDTPDAYAIKHAIIAVDEVLNVTREDPYPRKRTHMDKQYWQEVKQYLEEMI